MATSPSSPEASELRRRGRQRLIGAVVLVLLLVVFVPMLLDSEPRPSQDTPALAIPAKDKTAPLPPPAAPPAGAPKAEVAPAPAQPKPGPAPVKADAPAPAKVEPVKAAEPKKPADAPKLEGFAVQVGAFRDEDKLRQARSKLEAANVRHYTERLEVKGGTLTRLRAGPFATRDLAEEAQGAVRRAGLEGKVVPLP